MRPCGPSPGRCGPSWEAATANSEKRETEAAAKGQLLGMCTRSGPQYQSSGGFRFRSKSGSYE